MWSGTCSIPSLTNKKEHFPESHLKDEEVWVSVLFFYFFNLPKMTQKIRRRNYVQMASGLNEFGEPHLKELFKRPSTGYSLLLDNCIMYLARSKVFPLSGITQRKHRADRRRSACKNRRRDVGEYEGCWGYTVFFSFSGMGSFFSEGIVNEADKLACLVLFLLFQFHSTVREHFGHHSQEDKYSDIL